MLGGAEIDQPNDSSVGESPTHAQFAKILIQSHQDALLVVRPGQNDFITGIFAPVTSLDHIVSNDFQLRLGKQTNASVQQDLQRRTSSVSMRSLAVRRRA